MSVDFWEALLWGCVGGAAWAGVNGLAYWLSARRILKGGR